MYSTLACHLRSCNALIYQSKSAAAAAKHFLHFHLSVKALPQSPDISFWNANLRSHINAKNFKSALMLFSRMLELNLKPNELTFSLLIKASVSLPDSKKVDAQRIHAHLLKAGFSSSVLVLTALLDLYAKCGCISSAHKLFDEMPERDGIAWNALICGYSYNGYDFDALELFSSMLEVGLNPCRVTLVSIIPSCARQDLLFQGKSIHAYAVKSALALDSRVMNALTSMYAKCSDLDAAWLLFGSMIEKSVISWNTMIAAYGQNGSWEEALAVFNQMLSENVVPNSVTIVSLLSANVPVDSTHSYAVKMGLVADISVITSLICIYSRFGNTDAAELLYGLMPQKNLVSLTAIISGHVEKGDVCLALERFCQMQLIDMKPDAVAMARILQGFTNQHTIQTGISLHGYGIKSGLVSNVLVLNGLISMYSRCDDIEAAFSLFRGMQKRQLITWNLMISSCVQAGRLIDAVDLFCQMKVFRYEADLITMASMLSGCAQLRSLQLGKILHGYIHRNSLQMDAFIGTALIDMYAKCGTIENAERVFKTIEEPCSATWNSMIMGLALCGLEQQALEHYDRMAERGLKSDKITFLGVLSACSHAGLVEEGRQYFKLMIEVFKIAPGLQHCACMVNLLGRAGLLDEAVLFIKNMEVEPDSVVYGALLGACCIYQDIKLGECLARRIFFLDYRNCGYYLLMSNLYAGAGRWDDVARMRKMVKEDIGGDGYSGSSLIEVNSMHFLQENDW
ncbi:pentatricopeptide repeat-containing protein At2g04860 [Magnolia sinica]|uniref:pentatricopeptide repeat-containing protein At2g04860 n=1 Tax=Magnolia sinica TaxID=86752 RepID=UPI0026598F03|nr:pentatricopeptide repeat-containing protein At2g04860 [Magnolia sinica]